MNEQTVPQKPNRYNVELSSFTGPLDLLLFLIQKNEVNIYDIPIASITEQYMEFLKYAVDIDLDSLSDFYLMASTLIWIKSRMLLPVEIEFDEEYEDPRKELVERLIEYQKYKKYAHLISSQEETTEWILSRNKYQPVLPFDDQSIWEEIDVWDLLKTFSTLLANMSNESIFNIYEEVTVNEKTTYLIELLDEHEQFPFINLIVNEHSPMDIICSFLAILEAVKIRLIRVFQHTLFGDIYIQRREEAEAHEQ